MNTLPRNLVPGLITTLALLLAFSSQPPPSAPAPTEARFGAVEAYYRPADAVEAGIGWDRIIFEWRYLQPNGPNDWQPAGWERWLEVARRDGRMVVGLLKNAPPWATGSKLLGAPPKGLDLPIDDPGNTWAAFVRKTVTYFGTTWNIHHWIIYNEPDIRPEDTPNFEFAGNVSDYYKMVKVAYKVAHAADPEAVIHLAGTAFWQDMLLKRELYLERFLKLAYADPEARQNGLFFDVLTIHVFSGTEWVWRMTTQVKSLPESFGYPKPVWINEMNMRPTRDGDLKIKGPLLADHPEISLEEQASFIVQGSALALAAGAQRIAIYRLYDDNAFDGYEAWGLVRADGTRRPAYDAYRTVIEQFSGVTEARRFSALGVTLVALTRPGQTTYVVWNTTLEPVTVRIKAAVPVADATSIAPTGRQARLPPRDVAEGAYELTLAPCNAPCMVEGEPVILTQPGRMLAVWVLAPVLATPTPATPPAMLTPFATDRPTVTPTLTIPRWEFQRIN